MPVHALKGPSILDRFIRFRFLIYRARHDDAQPGQSASYTHSLPGSLTRWHPTWKHLIDSVVNRICLIFLYYSDHGTVYDQAVDRKWEEWLRQPELQRKG